MGRMPERLAFFSTSYAIFSLTLDRVTLIDNSGFSGFPGLPCFFLLIIALHKGLLASLNHLPMIHHLCPSESNEDELLTAICPFVSLLVELFYKNWFSKAHVFLSDCLVDLGRRCPC